MTAHAELSLLRIKDVSAKTGVPKASVYALIAKDDFPKPISLSAKSVAWVTSEVDAWIASRIALRNGVSK